MILSLCVLTPNRIVWDSEVKEIILSTNSGQIGILPNHAPIATAVDIGILRIRLNDQWLTMALMGGFARIGNNEVTVLVNDAEKGSDIDPQEAQQTLEIAEANLRKAEGKRQIIEANLALRLRKCLLAFKAHHVNIMFGNIKNQLTVCVGSMYFRLKLLVPTEQLRAASHVCQVNNSPRYCSREQCQVKYYNCLALFM